MAMMRGNLQIKRWLAYLMIVCEMNWKENWKESFGFFLLLNLTIIWHRNLIAKKTKTYLNFYIPIIITQSLYCKILINILG